MPVDYIQSNQDLQTTVFKQSVRMSTYLVAMVVSDFVSKSSPLAPNFSVYTYNPEINLPKTDYALTVGPKLLDYYANTYFKIANPLPKTDMISVPDFSMGLFVWLIVLTNSHAVMFCKNLDILSSVGCGIEMCQFIFLYINAHLSLVQDKWKFQ